ncbi:MAG: mitofilin family membrane protein [Magnetovibrionaceae bacterium]
MAEEKKGAKPPSKPESDAKTEKSASGTPDSGTPKKDDKPAADAKPAPKPEGAKSSSVPATPKIGDKPAKVPDDGKAAEGKAAEGKANDKGSGEKTADDGKTTDKTSDAKSTPAESQPQAKKKSGGSLAPLLLVIILLVTAGAGAWVTRPEWQPKAVELVPQLSAYLPPLEDRPSQPVTAVTQTREESPTPPEDPAAASAAEEAAEVAKAAEEVAEAAEEAAEAAETAAEAKEEVAEATEEAAQAAEEAAEAAAKLADATAEAAALEPASEEVADAAEGATEEEASEEASAAPESAPMAEPAPTAEPSPMAEPALAPAGSDLADRVAALEQLARAQGATSMNTMEEARSRFQADLDGLMNRLGGLEEQLGDVNRMVTATINAEKANNASETLERINERLAELEQSGTVLQGVLDRLSGLEEATREAAGRVEQLEARPASSQSSGGQALVLAVSQVQDAARRSGPFTEAFGALSRIAEGQPAVADILPDLGAFAETGAPTIAELRAGYADAARAAKQADVPLDGDSWWKATLNNLSGLVTIRRVGEEAEVAGDSGPSVDGLLSAAESALRVGDLATAVTALEKLPDAPKAAVADWVGGANARLAVEKALAALHVRAVAGLTDQPAAGE